jgi:hypothetical protein
MEAAGHRCRDFVTGLRHLYLEERFSLLNLRSLALKPGDDHAFFCRISDPA